MLKRMITTLMATGSILLSATQVRAQADWPEFFDGINNMGPYAWLSPADAQSNALTTSDAVVGGQAGGQSLALCRSTFPDGVHPGKLYLGNCHIGYGGQEVVKTSGFEVLYQTQPALAKYLSLEWVPMGGANRVMTFKGGKVGTTAMDVARVNYEGGVHPGKEWGGKCYIGYGGQEKALDAPYEVLILKFDKTAWQVAQVAGPAPTVTPITAAGPASSSDPNTWPTTFDGINSLGPYAWVDGPTALQGDPQLANAVYGGQVGNTRQAVCRAQFQDGIHPGKFFSGNCSVAWGGREVVLTRDYQVLVNTQPDKAQYLPQRWLNTGEGFAASSLGGMPLRVCRTLYSDGMHLGKLWQGNCYFGWGGAEKTDASYAMLFLDFDKTAWQAATQNPLINATTITLAPTTTQDVQVTLQTGPIVTTPLDPSILQQLQQPSTTPVVVSINWAPGSLGTGFDYIATYLPNLTYKMIDHYNATCTDPTLRRDRAEMYQAFKWGEVNTQAAMVLVMSEFAIKILSQDPNSLTAEERSYIKFLLALATDQRQRAGQEAMKNFQEWELQETQKRTSLGLSALIDPLVSPPPEILALAKAGYAVTPQTAENYMRVWAACSVPIAAGIGAGTVATLAATVGTATIAGALGPSVKIALNIGASVARGIPMMTGLAGGIAVATLMIQAAIMKGIDVVKYEEYKAALNQTVNDSQIPMTQEMLWKLLGTEEGLKSLASWLTAQAATGTTY